jgi:hypothetical protein
MEVYNMAVQTGIAKWASITSPNTKWEPQYCINLIVDDEVAIDFKSKGFPVKEFDEGLALVMKRKVEGTNGRVNSVPKLFDKAKNEIDVSVGNGSKVKVQYKEWESQRNGKTFKGFDLMAVQVLDLITFNGAGDEFNIEESLEESDEL